MFNKRSLLCVLLAIALSVGCMMPVAFAREEAKLVILHTNDSHGRVDESINASSLGLSTIATIKQRFLAENPNTLLLDAGDTFHGTTFATLTKGENIVELMNIAGYDAMTPGNHDFNYGCERLDELAQAANFPILSANILKDGESHFTQYTLFELEGVTVGVFGLTTDETLYKTHPNNVVGLTFADAAETAQTAVAALKEEGADVIIALCHLGTDASSVVKSTDIADAVEGIDVIIDGHSHSRYENGLEAGNNTLIASTGEYENNLGVVEITIMDGEVTAKAAHLIPKYTANGDVSSKFSELLATQEEITSEVIGATAVELDGARETNRAQETNLGNFIADAMRKETGADIAFTNGGGIRATIPAGDITVGDVISVLPFGNYIVTKALTGSQIAEVMEASLSIYPDLNGGFLQISGFSVTFDPEKPAGERVASIEIEGDPMDMDKLYLVATNDFIAAGGDAYVAFADTPTVNEYSALDEVVIKAIQEAGSIAPAVEGRVSVIGE